MSNNSVLQSSESNEWYTPASYVNAARVLMSGIELDPASCELANQTVKATKFYSKEQNGLLQNWHARSMWLNPPYGKTDTGKSNQEIWTHRLIAEYESGNIQEAVLLVNAVTGNAWFQPLWNYLLCFTDHRIRFYNADVLAVQPTHSNVLVYFGTQVARFIDLFSSFGTVVKRADDARRPLHVIKYDLWSGEPESEGVA